MIILIILSLIPLIIWAFLAPWSARFSTLNLILTSLGQILGLLGLTLFSVNLILAGRLKWLDRHFRGLDIIYQKHRLIGMLAFILILFHPLLLALSTWLLSPSAATSFFIPFKNGPITWGIFALILMMGLLILTLYFKLKYHIWKMSHKFLIIAFLLALIHSLVIPSDVSRSNLLKYYLLALAITGLVISFRQAFGQKLLTKNYKYEIVNVKALNDFVMEIEMAPLNKRLNFNPGQFAFFSFESQNVSPESHPFSISSPAFEANIRITIKNLGDFTQTLKNLKIGERVLIDGPYGHFSNLSLKNQNQVWIAGGIGVTPFLSMATSLNPNSQIDFYYSVRHWQEAIKLDVLESLSKTYPNFKVNLWNSEEQGQLTGQIIAAQSGDLINKEILFCGPSGLIEKLNNQLLSLGLKKKQLHYEKFNFLNF